MYRLFLQMCSLQAMVRSASRFYPLTIKKEEGKLCTYDTIWPTLKHAVLAIATKMLLWPSSFIGWNVGDAMGMSNSQLEFRSL